MSRTVRFIDREQAEIRAAQWIASIDRGLTQAEENELNDWLAQSPMHSDVLIQCAAMWDKLDVLSPIAKLLPIEEQDFAVEHSQTDSGLVSLDQQKARPLWLAFPLAASLLLLLSGVLAYLSFDNVPGSADDSVVTKLDSALPSPVPRGKVYQTEVGEISSVSLPDGSELQLNTGSKIRVVFDKRQRHIELLSGEVFFDVAHDTSRPFVVSAGAERVTALGTAFSVDATLGEATEVLVTEGKVRINRQFTQGQSAYQDVILTPGQKVVINENDTQVSNGHNVDMLLAWREGMLIFEGESLAEVIREIDRYTPLTFKIMDQKIAAIEVGGFFKTGDMNQLLLILEQNFGVTSYRLGNEVLLSKAVDH